MADECQKSDIMNTVEDDQEKMEEIGVSPDSGKVVGSPTQTPTTASKGASASPGEASTEPAADRPPSMPVQQSAPEPGSSGKEGKKSSSFFKTVKNVCKSAIKKISPRKQDKTPFVVPEGTFGVPVGAPPTAAAASGDMSRPHKGRRGTLVMESPTSEGRTLITEVSVSSDESGFPEDDARKASVASSDTAAHISMISNMDEHNVAKESGDETKSTGEVKKESGDESKSPDDDKKESGDNADIPMESKE